jgi:allophanate hydrolase subunit 2
LPGDATQRIQKGDQLYVAERLAQPQPAVRLKSLNRSSPMVLRALPGPQERLFTERGLDAFFSSEYRISTQSDRRGIRLEGSPVELVGVSDIPPEGTAPGSVQVPGNALPIILGPDRPVTGGYAKVATVIGADLGKLAQARPGERIRFEKVTIGQALAARLE